jgi:hypothetical protein
MASRMNPKVVPLVTYDYLFCLPSSERSWVPWVTHYDLVLSSGKQLENHIPRTGYGPTTPG